MNFHEITLCFASACALTSSATAMIEIDTSYVGDIGNANDASGYGGVDYGYHVGTYEVTNDQYVSFLNATGSTNAHGVYTYSMSIEQSGTSGSFTYAAQAGMGNKPVHHVSFWDAARFTNYLTSGDTEVGVYNLGGVTAPVNSTITRDATAWDDGGVGIASEDEWYKAAYYQPLGAGGDTDSYWAYATASNATPSNDLVGTDPGNNANFYQGGYTVGLRGEVTDVGEFENSASYYGTFDQTGNVWEWNDTISSSSQRSLRGGAFDASETQLLKWSTVPTSEHTNHGFRVSSLAPIPEPSAYAAIFGCLALTVATMRRKGRCAL